MEERVECDLYAEFAPQDSVLQNGDICHTTLLQHVNVYQANIYKGSRRFHQITLNGLL